MLTLLMVAGSADAADYVLVGPGKEIEVCQLYLKNLNSFPSYQPPMACVRPLNPKFADFTKPDWQPLEVLKNLDLLEHIERDLRGLTPEQFEKIKAEWRAGVKPRVTEFHLNLAIADLDVDRDGTTEPVVRYDSGECDPASESTFSTPSGTRFYVLTPDRARIDPQKTRWLAGGSRPDLFLYKGQVFVSSWAGNLGFKGGVLHFGTTLAVVGQGTIVCDYNYQGVWPRRPR